MGRWAEVPRSPGIVFYGRLQEVLLGARFDGFVEEACRAYYARTMGAPSVPPGRYFRMHMVGYFEGIDSERGIEWRCSDSLSYANFSGWRRPTEFRTIPGCQRHAAVCPMRCTSVSSAGFWPGLPNAGWCGASASAWMLQPWKPMPPCGRSCAGIPARATARC